MQEPVSGLADIKAKIEHLGLGGATVDLGCGSVDAQPSEAGAAHSSFSSFHVFTLLSCLFTRQTYSVLLPGITLDHRQPVAPMAHLYVPLIAFTYCSVDFVSANAHRGDIAFLMRKYRRKGINC